MTIKNYKILFKNLKEVFTKDVLCKLFEEFWLQLLISILWTFFTVKYWNSIDLIQKFVSSFFLISWFIGQFFRVKKQITTDIKFEEVKSKSDDISNKLDNIQNKLEEKTNQVLSYMTGGESFPYFSIAMINNQSNTGALIATHQGKYPLHDVFARIVDIQKFQHLSTNNEFSFGTMSYCDTNISIGNMIPHHSIVMVKNWKIENQPEQAYNIFFSTRNGVVTQLLRLNKKDGIWLSATKVVREIDGNETVLYKEIDEYYPKNIDGDISW
jgi:hypothetical protein